MLPAFPPARHRIVSEIVFYNSSQRNPTSRTQVMKELNRQVLFHDASMDITKAVLNTLNKRYEQDVAGGNNGGSSNTKSRTATRQKRTRKRR